MTRILLTALVLCATLGGGYWGLRAIAIRMATGPDGVEGSIVYQHTFGSALAGDAEQLLNDETTTPSFSGMERGSLTGGEPWHYHLAFTWHGLLVETADLNRASYPEHWAVSALGAPDPWIDEPNLPPYGRYSSLIEQLARDSGGAIPISRSLGSS